MSESIGKIVQIIGPVVDIRFENSILPRLYNAIKLKNNNTTIVAEVMQHLGNDTVRCVAMSSTYGLVRGMEAIDTGDSIKVPVGKEVLGRMFNGVFEPIDNLSLIVSEESQDINGSPINPKARVRLVRAVFNSRAVHAKNP